MSAVDPTLAARAGTIAPSQPDSAVRTIGRGLEQAPILRQGLGVTWLLAALGAAGRVVGAGMADAAEEPSGGFQMRVEDVIQGFVAQVGVRFGRSKRNKT